MRGMSGLFAGTPFERPVTCPQCEQPREECRCPRNAQGELCPPSQQSARVRREKRKGGKTVTVIADLDATASDLPALLKQFRQTLATGGSVVDGRIELQGDHRTRVLEMLIEQGYPAKPAGG